MPPARATVPTVVGAWMLACTSTEPVHSTPALEPPATWQLVETADGPRVELLEPDRDEPTAVGTFVAEVDLDHVAPEELVVIGHHHWSGTNIVVYRLTETGWTSVFSDYLFELRMVAADDGGSADLLVFRDDEDRWRSTGALTCTRLGWDAAAGEYVRRRGQCSNTQGAALFPRAAPAPATD